MKRVIVGIDEVGRGSLAGPLVLAAVALTRRIRWSHPTLGRIRDSKKLTPRRRTEWFRYLSRHPALRWRVTRITPSVIDRVNVSRAADRGALRLARKFTPRRGRMFVWLDGGLVLPHEVPHRTVIRGDERLPVVAAASIIAKVWRDRFMVRMERQFPEYGFAVHKGYGTRLHYKRLARYGPSRIHRRSFLA